MTVGYFFCQFYRGATVRKTKGKNRQQPVTRPNGSAPKQSGFSKTTTKNFDALRMLIVVFFYS